MSRSVLAIAAHPDDIELMMAGTLALLGRAGFELHVMNIADGSCGSMTEDAATTAMRRLDEAKAAAKVLNATHHPPIARDLEIGYDDGLLRQVASVVRACAPSIVLLQSPIDYMEDHMNASRLGVTATFARGMPNFVTNPPHAPIAGSVAVYHALPWGLRGPLREPVTPHFYVDVVSTLDVKRRALACHASQKEWLDQSQGLDSYLQTMEDTAAAVGKMSGRFKFAEGWRRHSHLGFGAEEFHPLRDALGDTLIHTVEELR